MMLLIGEKLKGGPVTRSGGIRLRVMFTTQVKDNLINWRITEGFHFHR